MHTIIRLSILIFFLSTQLNAQDDCIPTITGYTIVEGESAYYTFTPDASSPLQIVPCPTLFNGSPIAFSSEGSAIFEGNPPTVPSLYYVWEGDDLYAIDVATPCGQDNVSLIASDLFIPSGATFATNNGQTVLYAISGNDLHEIDPLTGTIISTIQWQACDAFVPSQIQNLAWDPNTNNLYTFESSVVFQFNLTNGCVTICFVDLINPGLIDVEGNGFSIDNNGTAYVEGSSFDDLGAQVIYSFELPDNCFEPIGPYTTVGSYEMAGGSISTLDINSNACVNIEEEEEEEAITAIPTLSQWGLICLIILLLTVSIIAIKKTASINSKEWVS